MDKNAIKKYAIWARQEMITRVSGRAAQYGVTEDGFGDINAESVNGRVLSDTEKRQRRAFIEKVQNVGYEEAIEEVAYTWFNRFCALRYMEVNGYLPSHVRIFTNDAGEFKPQIIDEALQLELDGLKIEKVIEYKNANDTEGLYRYLLITQCNALSSILPGMFQKIADYTELLLPDNLLREGSVISRMITDISEEDWTDQVQIIGWLYQYYNAEKKDEVFAALKKNVKISKDNIPAATQLFTPDWIVRYMVENSLGRLWVEGHPNNELKANWKYYLEDAEQEPEVEKELAEIRKEYATIKPEDIKCIDPCMGSGHILVYMFDVLLQIYTSYGYTTQEAVKSIVENNLYGLDIDERAAQLAYFAVMMKARSYDRRFFNRGIQPHVYAIEESNDIGGSYKYAMGDFLLSKEHQDTFNYLLDAFIDAKEYGSIIQLEDCDYEGLLQAWNKYAEATLGDVNMTLWFSKVEDKIPVLLEQAIILSQKYDVVVTNPPYMGSSNMSEKLSKFVKKNYPDSKGDLFACFIERGNQFVKSMGYNCMVTMQSWMFLSSFEKMRKNLLLTKNITNLMHMDNMVLGIAFGTAVTVFQNNHIRGYKGTYNYIKLQDIENERPKEFPVKENRFAQVCTDNFSKIPGSPVAYWVSDAFLNIFNHKLFYEFSISDGQNVTSDNSKFVRFHWEVNVKDIGYGNKWRLYAKGGGYRKWYGNLIDIVDWSPYAIEFYHRNSSARVLPEYLWYKKGITWGLITSGSPSFRILPPEATFDKAGSSVFLKNYDNYNWFLGLLNSKIFLTIAKVLNPTISLQVKDIRSIPVILDKTNEVNEIVNDCCKISKYDWDSFETSWDFQCHPFVRWNRCLWDATSIAATMHYYYGGYPKVSCPLELCYMLWQGECDDRFNKLKANEEELNRIFIDIYGLQDELTPEEDDKDVTVRKADLQRDIKSLISYAVGCMFGRYSLDVDGLAYAGGEWDASKYKTYQPDYNGILPICDDEYFTDDIVGHFIDFIKVVFGEDTLEENLQFIADALGGNGTARGVIRKYFLNDFYADHCKIYQKRPIYWLFDSGKKNGFKCLIYIHRYRPDTIARIRTDYVHEQQARYHTGEIDLENRVSNASISDKIKLNKELQKIQGQEEELQIYEEKIHHLADQYIDIDLDDGVKVNYAKFQDVLAKI